MKAPARRRQLVLVATLVSLSAFGVAYLWRHTQQASASRQFGAANDPHALLTEANRLSWLFNWTKAEPLYAQAEALFAHNGDSRNELYAKIGRIRGQAESMSFADISEFLSAQLEKPLVQNDPKLKLWCLAAKGYTGLEIDPASAKRAWEEVRAVAKKAG